LPLAGSSRIWQVRLRGGFEPHGAEIVSGGQVHVGVQGGGKAAQWARVGSVPPSSMRIAVP